jgi:hypothetical protein
MGTTLIITSTPRITYRIGMRTALGWADKFLLPPISRLGEVAAESELPSMLKGQRLALAQNRDKCRYQSVVEKACPARFGREGLRLAPALRGVTNSHRE